MAARNRVFPAPRPIVSKPVNHFNARNVVEKPVFTLARPTLDDGNLVNGHARRLTPREASRLQGMPEWASHHPTTTHALMHAGNAVAVPVARELGRQLGAILAART